MHGTEAPSPWIARWSHLVSTGGSVLDLACGRGRHLRWFASRGHPVLGVDRDADALASLRDAGETLQADIENGPWPLGERQFACVVVTNYLWRPLFPHIREAVAPGGVLLHETFAQGNETVGKPSRPDFLLARGELLRAYAGLRVVAYEDGFLAGPDRFVQRIAAVREGSAPRQGRYMLSLESQHSPGTTP
jgi:SAM-dependent methyltransferase